MTQEVEGENSVIISTETQALGKINFHLWIGASIGLETCSLHNVNDEPEAQSSWSKVRG